MLCSNDVLERLFGNIRMKYRQCLVDNLQLIYSARTIEACGDIMRKHPEWFKKNQNVMERLCLDWSPELLNLKSVYIISVWNVGRAKAEQLLNQHDKYKGEKCDFFNIAINGQTLRQPYGKKIIGVSEKDIDYSVSDEAEIEDEGLCVDDGDNDDVTSIIDYVQQPDVGAGTHMIHDCQVDVDGSYVYKATVMKNIFSLNPLSKDRLRRVRGMSTLNTEETDVSIETAVMVGDPILVNIKKKVNVTQIKLIKKGGKKVKMLDVHDINNENIFIDVLVLCLEDIDNECVWKGKYIGVGEIITVSGTECFAIQPTVKNVDGSMRFCFDKQFILDLNVGIAGQDNAELLGRKKQNQEAKKDTLDTLQDQRTFGWTNS